VANPIAPQSIDVSIILNSLQGSSGGQVVGQHGRGRRQVEEDSGPDNAPSTPNSPDAENPHPAQQPQPSPSSTPAIKPQDPGAPPYEQPRPSSSSTPAIQPQDPDAALYEQPRPSSSSTPAIQPQDSPVNSPQVSDAGKPSDGSQDSLPHQGPLGIANSIDARPKDFFEGKNGFAGTAFANFRNIQRDEDSPEPESAPSTLDFPSTENPQPAEETKAPSTPVPEDNSQVPDVAPTSKPWDSTPSTPDSPSTEKARPTEEPKSPDAVQPSNEPQDSGKPLGPLGIANSMEARPKDFFQGKNGFAGAALAGFGKIQRRDEDSPQPTGSVAVDPQGPSNPNPTHSAIVEPQGPSSPNPTNSVVIGPQGPSSPNPTGSVVFEPRGPSNPNPTASAASFPADGLRTPNDSPANDFQPSKESQNPGTGQAEDRMTINSTEDAASRIPNFVSPSLSCLKNYH
jgi:hypothetical protein